MNINFIFLNNSTVYTDSNFKAQNKIRFDKSVIVADVIYKIHQMGMKQFFPQNVDFFPSGIRSEWMWILEEEDKRELFIVYGSGEIYPIVDITLPVSFWIQDIDKPALYFIFYSTRKKRAKDLLIKYEGNKALMKEHNIHEEYEKYEISEEEESNWINEYVAEKEKISNLLYLKKQKEKQKELRKRRIRLSIETGAIALFLLIMGVNLTLLPYNPDSKVRNYLLKTFNAIDPKQIHFISFLLGMFFIITCIIVVFFAIRKNEEYTEELS